MARFDDASYYSSDQSLARLIRRPSVHRELIRHRDIGVHTIRLGRTNSEHRDSFPAAGPPLTTDWDFVLDFGIRRRDHWKADAGKVFGENPRSLAANHQKEEG